MATTENEIDIEHIFDSIVSESNRMTMMVNIEKTEVQHIRAQKRRCQNVGHRSLV